MNLEVETGRSNQLDAVFFDKTTDQNLLQCVVVFVPGFYS